MGGMFSDQLEPGRGNDVVFLSQASGPAAFRVGAEQVALLDRLRYHFNEPALFVRALTHRSVTPNPALNLEPLEYLGDLVMELAVRHISFFQKPNPAKVHFKPTASILLSNRTLKRIGESIGVDDAMLLSPGVIDRSVEGDAGKFRHAVSDCMEAIFGAVHLDGGFKRALEVVEHVLFQGHYRYAAEPEYQGTARIRVQVDAGLIDHDVRDAFAYDFDRLNRPRSISTLLLEARQADLPQLAKMGRLAGKVCAAERFMRSSPESSPSWLADRVHELLMRPCCTEQQEHVLREKAWNLLGLEDARAFRTMRHVVWGAIYLDGGLEEVKSVLFPWGR